MIVLLIVFGVVSFVIYALKSPSNDKKWSFGNNKNASINIDGDQITIENYRDTDWQNLDLNNLPKNDDSVFTTRKFQLSEIQSVKAVVSHFAVLSEIAHIFILFELKDKSVMGLSVEARKEQGEEYSLRGGLTARFELTYIFGSYRDLVGVRLLRDEDVYIYPIKATANEAQELFKVAARRTNELDKKPELYHLFVKNCTTEIVKLVNQMADKKFPLLTQMFMPGDAGKALYKMDLIDIEATNFKEIQAASLVKRSKN